MHTQKRYFYCYSPNLFRFLKYEKNLNYICTGINEKSMKRFWQFEGTEELNAALTEWSQEKKGSKSTLHEEKKGQI